MGPFPKSTGFDEPLLAADIDDNMDDNFLLDAASSPSDSGEGLIRRAGS
jgi:hypothetical protein